MATVLEVMQHSINQDQHLIRLEVQKSRCICKVMHVFYFILSFYSIVFACLACFNCIGQALSHTHSLVAAVIINPVFV